MTLGTFHPLRLLGPSSTSVVLAFARTRAPPLMVTRALAFAENSFLTSTIVGQHACRRPLAAKGRIPVA